MCDHLLESSLRDDSNKWSNIGFGEEIDIIEMKIRTLSVTITIVPRPTLPVDQTRTRNYSSGFKLIEKLNANAPQLQRTVLKYFPLLKNVAHSLKPCETPRNGVSPGFELCTTFLNLAKSDQIMSKNQFTGTATQPQRNRKICQFDNDQYCICHS